MKNRAPPSGVAVVTGAAGGMGSAMARQLAEAGWPQLLLCDIDAAKIETVAAPLREAAAEVEILAGDVSDPRFPSRLVAVHHCSGGGATNSNGTSTRLASRAFSPTICRMRLQNAAGGAASRRKG